MGEIAGSDYDLGSLLNQGTMISKPAAPLVEWRLERGLYLTDRRNEAITTARLKASVFELRGLSWKGQFNSKKSGSSDKAASVCPNIALTPCFRLW